MVSSEKTHLLRKVGREKPGEQSLPEKKWYRFPTTPAVLLSPKLHEAQAGPQLCSHWSELRSSSLHYHGLTHGHSLSFVWVWDCYSHNMRQPLPQERSSPTYLSTRCRVQFFVAATIKNICFVQVQSTLSQRAREADFPKVLGWIRGH